MQGVSKHLLEEAEKFVFHNDRMHYAPYFAALENYMEGSFEGSRPKVVLGGQVGLDLITGKPLSSGSFSWDVYAEDAYETAKEIARLFAGVENPRVDSSTTAMLTVLRHREFEIRVNTVRLVKLYAMDQYRGIKLIDLMGVVPLPGYFAQKSIRVIPPDLHLINIYRTLSSPGKVGKWADAVRDEDLLHKGPALPIPPLEDVPMDTPDSPEVSGGAQQEIPKSVLASVEKLVSKSILIGDRAIERLGIMEIQRKRTQIISSEDISTILESLKRDLANYENAGKRVKINPKHGFIAISYKLNIPDDFQLTKHTVYYTVDGTQISLVDVFNDTSHDLIPVMEGVAAHWTILRHLYIDLWIIRILVAMGKSATKIDLAFEKISSVRKDIERRLDSDPSSLFPIKSYSGRFIDDEAAKKKFIQTTGEFFAPYYPAALKQT